MCVSFATHVEQLGSGGPEGRCRAASTLAQAQTFYRYDTWGTRERYFINHHCSHRLNYGIFTNTDDNKRENKKNFLHLIDMAKNKTVLQTLGFT